MVLHDMKVCEAADTFNCSEKLIRKLIETGDLKSYRIGKAVRIPAEEIERIKQGVAEKRNGSQ